MLHFTAVTATSSRDLENKVNEMLHLLRDKEIVDKQLTSHYHASSTGHDVFMAGIWYRDRRPAETPPDLPPLE